MASRKKANGKARRAAKSKTKAAAHHNQLLGVQVQMNDALISGGTAKCNHGLVPSHYHCHRQSSGGFLNTSNMQKICNVFLQAFVYEFDSAAGDFLAAYHVTKGKFAEVWNDLSMMSFVVSFLLACGTSKILEGNIRIACKYASLGSYFEQYVEVDLLNIRACPNWPKIRELYAADEHTLFSFLKKRIPCSCLDEGYKLVKSTPKIGLCCNPHCPLPCGRTERSATMCCSRCRAANYCSRECQVAVWHVHKGECKFYTDLKAKFRAESSQQLQQHH
jgi:hypothetical protein